MKITLEEAYAKAAMGPVMAVEDHEFIFNLETRTHPIRPDKRLVIASLLVKEDAVLFAHARNVLPDVVCTMKYISANIRTLSRLAIQQQLDDVIAKVSTVELP